MTQQEAEFFYDIARGSQSAVLEFLFIRNKLLATWLADPTQELTANKAQSVVLLPQAGEYWNTNRAYYNSLTFSDYFMEMSSHFEFC